MVQLNSTAQLNAASAGSLGSAGSLASSITSNGDSFAQELETAIEGIVSQSGNGSQFEIDVKTGPSSNGATDYTITVKNFGSAATTSAAPVAAASTSTSAAPVAHATIAAQPASILDELMPSPAGTTPSIYNPSAAISTTTPTIDKSQMTPDDAYWAEQPPAVQALRNMDPADRSDAAKQLAQQGYQIDVPIMVWGWDPLSTMIERQNYGYTWVPGAMQSPVAVAPGVNFPGLPSYDANNPPAGSIKVTTDFAAGTNMQDAFVDPVTIRASMSPGVSGQSQNQLTIQSSI